MIMHTSRGHAGRFAGAAIGVLVLMVSSTGLAQPPRAPAWDRQEATAAAGQLASTLRPIANGVSRSGRTERENAVAGLVHSVADEADKLAGDLASGRSQEATRRTLQQVLLLGSTLFQLGPEVTEGVLTPTEAQAIASLVHQLSAKYAGR